MPEIYVDPVVITPVKPVFQVSPIVIKSKKSPSTLTEKEAALAKK